MMLSRLRLALMVVPPLLLLLGGCGGGGGTGGGGVDLPTISAASVTPTELRFTGGNVRIMATVNVPTAVKKDSQHWTRNRN